MEMQTVDHLIAAVLRRDADAVSRLLATDPSLRDARSMFGVGGVHAAHFTGATELVALLLPGGPHDVFLAAELGAVDRVETALAADPGLATRPNERGATALHGACYWGQRAAAEVLLAAGADPDAVTGDPFLRIRPLGSAVATTPGVQQPSDDEDVVLALVRLLLEHGADPAGRRGDGATALHAAAWRGLDRVVQELLDAGVDPALIVTDGPHAGQTAADMALGQAHLVLAARLDTGAADVASPYG